MKKNYYSKYYSWNKQKNHWLKSHWSLWRDNNNVYSPSQSQSNWVYFNTPSLYNIYKTYIMESKDKILSELQTFHYLLLLESSIILLLKLIKMYLHTFIYSRQFLRLFSKRNTMAASGKVTMTTLEFLQMCTDHTVLTSKKGLVHFILITDPNRKSSRTPWSFAYVLENISVNTQERAGLLLQ